MRFSTSLCLALGLAQMGAAQQMSGKKVVAAIESITMASGNLNDKLQNTNGAISTGQAIISGFKDIVSEVTKDISTFGLGGGRQLQKEMEQTDVMLADMNMTTIQDTVEADGMTRRAMSGSRKSRRQTVIIIPDQQDAVCQGLITFVKVHQALLATVIGKKGLLSSTPLTAPIAAVLRAVEAGVDTLAFGIIALVPTCADDVRPELKSLDDSLGKTIKVYSIFPGVGGFPGIGKENVEN